MNTNIRKFRPSANWITTVLVTLIVATFGIFAQTHASERGAGYMDTNSHGVLLMIRPCKGEANNSTHKFPTLNY